MCPWLSARFPACPKSQRTRFESPASGRFAHRGRDRGRDPGRRRRCPRNPGASARPRGPSPSHPLRRAGRQRAAHGAGPLAGRCGGTVESGEVPHRERRHPESDDNVGRRATGRRHGKLVGAVAPGSPARPDSVPPAAWPAEGNCAGPASLLDRTAGTGRICCRPGWPPRFLATWGSPSRITTTGVRCRGGGQRRRNGYPHMPVSDRPGRACVGRWTLWDPDKIIGTDRKSGMESVNHRRCHPPRHLVRHAGPGDPVGGSGWESRDCRASETPLRGPEPEIRGWPVQPTDGAEDSGRGLAEDLP